MESLSFPTGPELGQVILPNSGMLVLKHICVFQTSIYFRRKFCMLVFTFICLLFFFFFCSNYSQVLFLCFTIFFWDIFFLGATSSSGLGTIHFFFSKDHLSTAARAFARVDGTVSSVGPVGHLGGFVLLDVLHESTSKPLCSTLL